MCEGAELYRKLAKEAVKSSLLVKEAKSNVLSRCPDMLGVKDIIYLYDKMFKEQKEMAETLGLKASSVTGSITGKTKDYMYRKLLEEIRNDESRE